jgi:hypothetical protein
MIEQVSPTLRRTGETARHLSLKALAAIWAAKEGMRLVAPEVSFPHRRFIVDVAACAPSRKVPSRQPVAHISSLLKAAAIFECKQARSDLIRDNKKQARLSEKLKSLEARRLELEALMQIHLPHLANGEALFPEFDSYRLREHKHAPYQKLMREIGLAKRGVIAGTKFDRLYRYKMANLHYLVAEEGLLGHQEVPIGWGLLVRRDESLELVIKPVWQVIGIEEQAVFLQRMTAKKSIFGD